MAAIFTAFDLTAIEAAISAIALSGVAIALIYLGWTHVSRGRKGMQRS